MSNCKKCGKPLVLSGGKCIYCGEPIQGYPQTPWTKTEKTSQTNFNKDWRKALLRKTWFAILAILLLGVLPLVYKAWPGCLVSIIMLVSAISLGILTYHIINIREGDHPGFKQDLESNMKNILNLVLICTAFFFIGGLICLFTEDCKWWVWAIIVWLGVSGGPLIVGITLDPESFDGKEES